MTSGRYSVLYKPASNDGVLRRVDLLADSPSHAAAITKTAKSPRAILPPQKMLNTGAPRFAKSTPCPSCGFIEATVVCQHCEAFKFKRQVPSFANELDDPANAGSD